VGRLIASCSGGSIIVKQIGHAILTVSLPSGGQEEFLLTLPRLRIDGLWYVFPVSSTNSLSYRRRYGSPYIELCESSYIIGGGFISLIEYKGKGYFSGRSHSFKATVSPQPGMNNGTGAGEHVIEGTWHVNSKFTKGGGTEFIRNGGLFHDVESVPKEEVSVVGGDGNGEMSEFESRLLWKQVAKGIREGDFETASREKTRIEVRL
jgi:oxysterol-binding protein-related protein 9/10/11